MGKSFCWRCKGDHNPSKCPLILSEKKGMIPVKQFNVTAEVRKLEAAKINEAELLKELLNPPKLPRGRKKVYVDHAARQRAYYRRKRGLPEC